MVSNSLKVKNPIRSGPYVFTSACEGSNGENGNSSLNEITEQCQRSYGRIRSSLEAVGLTMSSVVRLDHFVQSQDWLPLRSAVRAKIFGDPAQLASTGIEAILKRGNLLTTTAICVADALDKQVMISGAAYGMEHICTVVRGARLLFISGLRTSLAPNLSMDTGGPLESFWDQLRQSCELLRDVLAEVAVEPGRIVRLDCYIREGQSEDEVRKFLKNCIPESKVSPTIVSTSLGLAGDIELTAIAAASGLSVDPVECEGDIVAIRADGLVFIGQIDGVSARKEDSYDAHRSFESQLGTAISTLERRLILSGSDPGRLARLDCFLRDMEFAPDVQTMIERRFGYPVPNILTVGAATQGESMLSLNAIGY